MNTTEKGKLISAILSHLQYHAKENNKAFDYGDTFFSLAFKSDKELVKISKLCGC